MQRISDCNSQRQLFVINGYRYISGIKDNTAVCVPTVYQLKSIELMYRLADTN